MTAVIQRRERLRCCPGFERAVPALQARGLFLAAC